MSTTSSLNKTKKISKVSWLTICLTLSLPLLLTSCLKPHNTLKKAGISTEFSNEAKEQQNLQQIPVSNTANTSDNSTDNLTQDLEIQISTHNLEQQTTNKLAVLLLPDYTVNPNSPITINKDLRSNYWLSFSKRNTNFNAQTTLKTKKTNTNYAAKGLWGDLAKGFQFYELHNERLTIQRHIKRILKNPRIFHRTTAAASPYLHFVYSEIKKRQLPMELALLPIVESRYYPFAVSRSNAAGIWQFTRRTGAHYGLDQNWWYDGRLDIYQSTKSALNLLEDLFERYQSWPLALAAYNFGIGNVNKAIKRAKKRNKPTDYFSIKLPRETRNYVPKLLAYCHIIANFKRYEQLNIHHIANKPTLAQVTLNRPFELQSIAKASRISLRTFRKFNPGFKRWATRPDETYTLMVPLANLDHFQKTIKKVAKTHRIKWRSHRVRSGDTLYDIAKHYGLSVSELKRANRLTKHIIKIGENLIIPARKI